MTASYDTSLATDKDKVRLYLGDTDTENPKTTDEEIIALLAIYPNPIKTTIILAQSLLAKYAAMATQSVGEVSVSYGELRDNYKNLVAELKERFASEYGKLIAGGLSQSEKDSLIDDSDRVQPAFTRDLHKKQ